MLRRLKALLLRVVFLPPVWYAPLEEEENPLNDDEQLEEFLAENGFVPLMVKVCDNPCGCLTLETRGELLWGYATSERQPWWYTNQQ